MAAKDGLSSAEHRLVTELVNAGAKGFDGPFLEGLRNEFPELRDSQPGGRTASSRATRRGLAICSAVPRRRGIARSDRSVSREVGAYDLCRFSVRSQSGFSTTGATVIADLEDPVLVPHCIGCSGEAVRTFLEGSESLCCSWRFWAEGSAGKALMRAEMPGPSKEGSQARMQHTAWLFAAIYCGLNAVLTVALWQFGLSWFDALCHALERWPRVGFPPTTRASGILTACHRLHRDSVHGAGRHKLHLAVFPLFEGSPDNCWQDIEWRAYIGITPRSHVGSGFPRSRFRRFLRFLGGQRAFVRGALRTVPGGFDHDDNGVRHARLRYLEQFRPRRLAVVDVCRGGAQEARVED